jgi:pimeloyl-ACP methyl ester carboxylesterase
MSQLYKSEEGEKLVRERYLAFLKHWPVPNQQVRVPTRSGETFVVASGDATAPPLVLLHGGLGNSVMWTGDIVALAAHFRVYSIDLIGEPGLSAAVRLPLASDAHACWLDDVMEALKLERTSIVGISLGGWLALDYATRRPERVQRLVALCPGGVGRQKIGVLFKVLPLRLCGAWGANKARQIVLGRAPAKVTPGIQEFVKFVILIHENFRPRLVKMPIFSDDA